MSCHNVSFEFSLMEEIFWEYKGLTEFMGTTPGVYSLDSRRTELHKKLEKCFEGREKELAIVLHDLPLDFMPEDLCWAVSDIKDFRRYLRKEREEERKRRYSF